MIAIDPPFSRLLHPTPARARPLVRRNAARRGVICCLLAWATCSTALADVRLPGSVLILNQSTSLRPWPMRIIAGLRSSLRDAQLGPIAYNVEHLDLYEFDSPQYRQSVTTHLVEKYRDRPVGVIVAIGPAALEFALKRPESLWAAAPIVFAAVDEDAAARQSSPDVTGVAIRMTLASMIEAARTIVPGLKRVAIVGDRFEGQFYYRHFADEIPNYSGQLEFIDLMGLPLREVRQRVAALPDDSAILFIGINSDPERTYAAGVESLPLVAAAANRPIIVSVETFLGYGATGGFLLSPNEIGRETAARVQRVMGGERPGDIPVSLSNAMKPIFDWQQLQRWGVDENRLPAGSEIRFREPSLWDEHRVQILLAIAAFVVQAALIVVLFQQNRRRQKAEVAARHTLSELTQVNRLVTAGVLMASITHEVSQPLTAIMTNGHAAMRWLAAEVPDIGQARASLDRLVVAGGLAGEVIGSVRAMFSKDSHEEVSVDLNKLVTNVLSIVRADLQQYGMSLRMQLSDDLPAVNGDPVQLQQVILNLMMNAIESMLSAPLRVLSVESTVVESGAVRVSIGDTGKGIDQANRDRIFKALFTTKTGGMGMGLAICHSIVESHYGRIWVAENPGAGAIFRFELPQIGGD